MDSNRFLLVFGGPEHDDFEHARLPVEPEMQEPLVIAEVENDERMLNGVLDVLVRDAVSAR